VLLADGDVEYGEVARRILLEYTLWKGDEKGLVPSVREQAH
jgi:hypothetical protein